jgi:cytochrome c-type biogenesis protein CcsB
MTLQNSLANYSFLTLLGSMVFYWIETSFTGVNLVKKNVDRPEALRDSESLILINNKQTQTRSLLAAAPKEKKGLLHTFIGSLPSFGKVGFLKDDKSVAKYGILISNILLSLLLLLRWKESGHFPLSNLYESLMFLSWCFTTLHLYIDNYTSLPTSLKKEKNEFVRKLLGAITTPSALLTNAFATFTLPKEMQEAAPLVPALQSNWLMMHVTVMILSYAALILGSLMSIAFLIVTAEQKEVYFSPSNPLLPSAANPPGGEGLLLPSGGLRTPFEISNPSFQKYPGEISALNMHEQTQGCVLPSLRECEASREGRHQEGTSVFESKQESTIALTLDNLSYRILGIGFPLLTIGILSGAVWANEAWGSYWSWDPKETWALLTWLIYAIYLHTRLSKGWEGKKPAIIASLGFVIVWMCYLGVNLIGEGLHSYGWIVQS